MTDGDQRTPRTSDDRDSDFPPSSAPSPIRSTGSAYTRFVRRLRIILPLAALALGVVVLIYAGTFEFKSETPDFVLSTEVNSDLRMISPRLSGTDPEGRPYLVTAQSATQDPNDSSILSMQGIEGGLLVENGKGWVALLATEGRSETKARTLELSGKVDLFSDSGYEFHTSQANLDLNAGTLDVPAPVTAHGPAGFISADSMTASERGQKVTFTGNVHTVIFADANETTASEE